MHPEEHDDLCLMLGGGEPRQAERVAPRIGESDDLLSLVVMPEDDQTLPERLAGGADAAREVLVGRGRVVVGEWTLEADHGDPLYGASIAAGGDSLVAHPRVCRPRGVMCPPGYQAGVSSMLVLERPKAIPDEPGSYQFKDADGRVIYVGKAKSLRSRLS